MDPAPVRVETWKPSQTQGVKAIIEFIIAVAHNPFLQDAFGAFGGGLLKVSGEKFSGWFCDFLRTK